MNHRMLPLGVATTLALLMSSVPAGAVWAQPGFRASANETASETAELVFVHQAGAQTFTVPNGVTRVQIHAYGARGGNSGTGLNAKLGGTGGTAFGDLPVTPGQKLTILVGGPGRPGGGGGPAAGGFNGGGASGGSGAGGGGGASSVFVPTGGGGYAPVIIAAGGGGAAGGDGEPYDGAGGDAGAYGHAGSGNQPSCFGGGGGGYGTLQYGGDGRYGAYRPPYASSHADEGTDGGVFQGGRGGSLDLAGGGGGGGFFGGGGGGAGRVFTNPICFGYPGGGGGGSNYVHPTVANASTGAGWSGPPRLTIRYEVPPEPPAPTMKTPTAVKASAKPKRDRKAPYVYRVRGKVSGAFADNAANCRGQVRFTVKRAKRVLARSTTQLSSTCGITKRIKITRARLGTRKSVRLAITVRFVGNAQLKPSQRTVWVRAN